MHKIDRLMAILLVLNKNKRTTAKELADKFEVDIRTIYRDMQALSEMNIPIISEVGQDGGYYLESKYFIPPIMFNKDELFSLMLSKKVIEEIEIPGYSEYIKSAFLKLESVMSDSIMDSFETIEKRVKFNKKDKAIPPKDFKFFTIIKSALENNYKIKIKYFSSVHLEMVETMVEPYGLVFVDDTWAVVCFCPEWNSAKSIDINSITNAELTDEKFVIPQDFNVDMHYCKNHCTVKCKEKANYEYVKVKTSKASYYKLKDYIYFNHGEVIEESDHYILNIKSKNPDGYISVAFRFYGEFEILEPIWLREKFLDELDRIRQIYMS